MKRISNPFMFCWGRMVNNAFPMYRNKCLKRLCHILHDFCVLQLNIHSPDYKVLIDFGGLENHNNINIISNFFLLLLVLKDYIAFSFTKEKRKKKESYHCRVAGVECGLDALFSFSSTVERK